MRSNWSLRISLVLVVLALVALLAPRSWIEGLTTTANGEATEDTATVTPSELVFVDLDGGEHRLADALERGPVILDFWATWCAPCKKAMPAYDALRAEYADRGVQLWAVSWDSERMVDRIEPWFEDKGFTFPALRDPDRAGGEALGVRVLPTTFLIAPDGTIAWRHQGYADGDERDLEDAVLRVLGQTSG
ncbi:MAG TPA: TlpA disulfide reductase family protein [Candidatus Krumholzibacteria bacterium]|nr:TlpA disulfide reductase family protein [Candidatus Krumholzibacteria bacterium]